jgi:hypothetical protein
MRSAPATHTVHALQLLVPLPLLRVLCRIHCCCVQCATAAAKCCFLLLLLLLLLLTTSCS